MGLSVAIRADSKFPVDRKKLRKALADAWQEYGRDGEVNVSIAIVGSRKMAELNQQFLKKEGPVSVLAFPQQNLEAHEFGFVTANEIPLELGDIVICYPLALDEAVRDGTFVDEKIMLLALHGLKHLIGVEEM